MLLLRLVQTPGTKPLVVLPLKLPALLAFDHVDGFDQFLGLQLTCHVKESTRRGKLFCWC